MRLHWARSVWIRIGPMFVFATWYPHVILLKGVISQMWRKWAVKLTGRKNVRAKNANGNWKLFVKSWWAVQEGQGNFGPNPKPTSPASVVRWEQQLDIKKINIWQLKKWKTDSNQLQRETVMGRELVRGAEDAEGNPWLARMGRRGKFLGVLEKRETLEVVDGRSNKVEMFKKYFCSRPGKQQCYVSVS